jgi:hypothetical protein
MSEPSVHVGTSRHDLPPPVASTPSRLGKQQMVPSTMRSPHHNQLNESSIEAWLQDQPNRSGIGAGSSSSSSSSSSEVSGRSGGNRGSDSSSRSRGSISDAGDAARCTSCSSSSSSRRSILGISTAGDERITPSITGLGERIWRAFSLDRSHQAGGGDCRELHGADEEEQQLQADAREVMEWYDEQRLLDDASGRYLARSHRPPCDHAVCFPLSCCRKWMCCSL